VKARRRGSSSPSSRHKIQGIYNSAENTFCNKESIKIKIHAYEDKDMDLTVHQRAREIFKLNF
jgi:hypothetical protein